MQITFLGGGNEIGASSAIVEIGASRVLIDCGIRMSGDDRLPDLSAIRGGTALQHLDAVLLTHAHMDHSGALPVVHEHCPGVPVYATAPTCGLVEVLLRDALNIMRTKAESENELPLYTPAAVATLLEQIIPVPFGAPTQVSTAGLTATWFPAGHILGAASVGIEGVENGRTIRVLFSGDIAVSDQLTVPGMLAPTGFRPDVLVIESTYGDRLHASRALEEQRLLDMVAGVIGRQGKLLIPAFAIGRAQEVILMLLRQFRAKRLASFPVYVDGMVRTVCGVYASHPAHQTPFARRLVERHGNPFFNSVDEIRAVQTPAERERVLAGPPCVIIASSGMLTGGASAYYAPYLVGDERHGIAITGYQDEESPGRHLLDLAEAKSREVHIAGRVFPVACSVAKYALSAHADCNEIAGLIDAIAPREVVLVHGEGQSRPALRDLLQRRGTRHRPIHLPRTGDTLSFYGGHHLRPHVPPAAALSDGTPLTAASLHDLATKLRTMGGEGKLYSAVALLDHWYGAQAWDEDNYAALIQLLDDHEDFRRPASRPHLYRLLRLTEQAEAPPLPSAEATMFYATPQDVLGRVDRTLGPETGLYRRGYDLARHELRLSFAFPLVARERYRAACDEIVADTGWHYTLNETPHQGRLVEVALACLPPEVTVLKPPAIHLDRQVVVVMVGTTLDHAVVQQAAAAFQEQTGYGLRVQGPQLAPAPGTATGHADGGALSPPMEINAAYRVITEAFSQVPVGLQPSRMGMKSDHIGKYLELSFITPMVGQRQEPLLTELSQRIGWRLRIKPQPNQHALIELASDFIPTAWRLTRPPSVHVNASLVRARCATPPAPDDPQRLAVCAQFLEQTGYGLEVVTR
jgi:Cft2 family RNA processing exonuclease